MNCPYCDEPMKLIRGEKFWWHIDKGKNWRNPKAVKCPITCIPNQLSAPEKEPEPPSINAEVFLNK